MIRKTLDDYCPIMLDNKIMAPDNAWFKRNIFIGVRFHPVLKIFWQVIGNMRKVFSGNVQMNKL